MSSLRERLPQLAEKYQGTADLTPAEFPILIIDREQLAPLMQELHDDAEMDMKHLSSLSGVDYVDYLEVVYHLYSYGRKHQMVVKVRLTPEDKKLPTVIPVWSTADWHERETYDFYGIIFEGHPNLTRILLAEDFPGHPLLKSFPNENLHEYLVE